MGRGLEKSRVAKPISIKVLGIQKSMKYLLRKNADVQKAVEKSINASASMLVAEVKESISGHRAEPTSVDTSRFLNSVNMKDLGKFAAEVFSPIEYAIYLEHGTSRIQARRHFSNSKDRKQKAIQQIIQTAVKLATIK